MKFCMSLAALSRCAALVPVLAAASSARAERVVLAPSARATLPAQLLLRSVWDTDSSGRLSWLHIGWPQEDLGAEIELSSYRLGGRSAETVGLHYSVISEAISNNLAPGVAIGVRDLLNRGDEGRAIYLALSKTMPLSEMGERILGTLRLHAGYGSGRMGGGYLGASAETPFRVSVAVELLNRRTNWSASFWPIRPVAVEWLRTSGASYLGLRVVLSR